MYKNYTKEVLELLEDKNYIITNTDFDGLLSLAILQKYRPHMQLGGWYNNNNLYMDCVDDISDYIALDISFTEQLPIDSISNHIELNSNGISCNSHIDINNYNMKSLFSTSVFLWASLDSEHLNNMTDEQIKILLSVDAMYAGWFSHNGRFKDRLYNYLKAYNLYRFIEVLENSTLEDFKRIESEYNLYHSESLMDGYYNTHEMFYKQNWQHLFKLLGLDVPHTNIFFNFALIGKWRKGSLAQYQYDYKHHKVISSAMIYKDVIAYTTFEYVRYD